MRLFLYGTLLDPATLAKQSGAPRLRLAAARPDLAATLAGWRRTVLPGRSWPTLRRARNGRVPGIALTVTANELRRLTAYEGPAYRLTPVTVRTRGAPGRVGTWIAPGGLKFP